MDTWWYDTAKWDLLADNKYRLCLPAELLRDVFNGSNVENMVYLSVDEETGCILITANKNERTIYGQLVKKNNSSCRIIIPIQLRNTTSFYFGRRVTLSFNRIKNQVEVWPRPE